MVSARAKARVSVRVSTLPPAATPHPHPPCSYWPAANVFDPALGRTGYQIDLHYMGINVASAVLRAWLLYLRVSLQRGRVIPPAETLSVVTGERGSPSLYASHSVHPPTHPAHPTPPSPPTPLARPLIDLQTI